MPSIQKEEGRGKARLNMKDSDKKDIKSMISICEIKLYGEEETQFFTDCRLEATEKSECIVIKIKGTESAIKIKKTALLNLMGYGHDYKKYTERI